MNNITVYGRVSSESIETRDVGGRNVSNFNLAGNTRRKDKTTDKYITNFYRVCAWGAMSDTASRFLHKGDRVCVSGELVIRKYKDQNGVDRLSVEIDATGIDLVETKAEAETKAASAPTQSTTPPEPAGDSDPDLPF